ncbi:MAG: hypothetical protein M5U29_11660 [Anaerolineae bacterium]|nr:hypothetical protein [Anaerolineae bacterium]
MDGRDFGVGITEMIIIALVLFVVGGAGEHGQMGAAGRAFCAPDARDVGRVHEGHRSELGPEGKELMDVTRELGQGAADLRRSTSPRRLLSGSARAMDALARDDAAARRPGRRLPPAAEPSARNRPRRAATPPPKPRPAIARGSRPASSPLTSALIAAD